MLSEVQLPALAESGREAQLASRNLLNHYKTVVFNLVPRAYTTRGGGKKKKKNKKS